MTATTAHRWQTCQERDCASCQANVDDGYVISCDECGDPGHADSDGWVMSSDHLLYCLQCAHKLGEHTSTP
jgi:ferredoxin